MYSTANKFCSPLLAELGALPELSAEVHRRSELCATELAKFGGCSDLTERDTFRTLLYSSLLLCEHKLHEFYIIIHFAGQFLRHKINALGVYDIQNTINHF